MSWLLENDWVDVCKTPCFFSHFYDKRHEQRCQLIVEPQDKSFLKHFISWSVCDVFADVSFEHVDMGGSQCKLNSTFFVWKP